MEQKERLNIYIPKRLKRQLKEISIDKNMAMNDIIVSAIADAIDRQNLNTSAPDIVLDRVGQVLNSQIALIAANQQLQTKMNEILDRLPENEEE